MPNNKSRRNANGAGTIRKRSDGLWQGIMTVGIDYGTGKPKKKSVYGKTQKQVRQKMTAIRHDLDNRIYTDAKNMKVCDWCNIWLTQFCTRIKPNTVKIYNLCIKSTVIPSIGNVKLSDLNTVIVQKMFNDLSKDGKAPTTITTYYRVFHACCEKAVQLEYIAKNPCNKVTITKTTMSHIDPLSTADLKQFFSLSQQTIHKDFFFIAVLTGMREGQILGLTWDAIDYENGQINIQKQILWNKTEPYFGTPKSGKSRVIDPAPQVFDRLKQMQESDIGQNPMNLVFHTAIGNPLRPSSVNHDFVKIRNAMNRPTMRIHDLRHSYATISLENGDNLKTVSEALGHSTIAITGNIYAHVTKRMKNESAKRMSNLLNTLDVVENPIVGNNVGSEDNSDA